ncbi:hypothetical protein QAD02_011588 [Eretmocerus hayati]|uniref:Uncharacterized protein n=1 Tax=Eretmocerus hayati TaxID=131215 RepID=A0ACC2NXG1_9HYME|nr:hypothetical protein QAD02_011588 [Eretmocerus hayati]
MKSFIGFMLMGVVLGAREFLDVKKLEPLAADCVKEQGMEYSKFIDIVMNNTDEKDDKARCALLCSLKKLDVDGKAGTIDMKKLESIIPDDVLKTSKDAVLEGLNKCIVETKNDKGCDLAKDVFICGKNLMAKLDNTTAKAAEAPK